GPRSGLHCLACLACLDCSRINAHPLACRSRGTLRLAPFAVEPIATAPPIAPTMVGTPTKTCYTALRVCGRPAESETQRVIHLVRRGAFCEPRERNRGGGWRARWDGGG